MIEGFGDGVGTDPASSSGRIPEGDGFGVGVVLAVGFIVPVASVDAPGDGVTPADASGDVVAPGDVSEVGVARGVGVGAGAVAFENIRLFIQFTMSLPRLPQLSSGTAYDVTCKPVEFWLITTVSLSRFGESRSLASYTRMAREPTCDANVAPTFCSRLATIASMLPPGMKADEKMVGGFWATQLSVWTDTP